MRKVCFILGLVLLSACRKVEIPKPVVSTNTDIFAVSKNEVTDGQEIKFTLKEAGVYTLTIGNESTGQVVTRERFTGIRL
jgi:hypothetical protein